MFAMVVLVTTLAVWGSMIWLIARQEARRSKPVIGSKGIMDGPRLGPSMSWLSVGTDDVNRLIATLGLIGAQSCPWNSGVEAIYYGRKSDKTIFVTVPAHGWVLVSGVSLPQPLRVSFVDKTTPFLLELSEAFGEVQYFSTFPRFDHYA